MIKNIIFCYYSKFSKYYQGVNGLLDTTGCKVITWTGEEKSVRKIAFFAEKDQKGDIFFKIEGQNNSSQFMVDYSYDRSKALKKYLELLDKLIDSQVLNLSRLEYQNKSK